jgi:lipoate-protein ligase B
LGFLINQGYWGYMFMDVNLEIFPHWPYDDALKWMSSRSLTIKKFPKSIWISCGSHLENVISLGRNEQLNNLNAIKTKNLKRYIIRKLDRGGGITAHEPGQLVLYPMFNIRELGLSATKLINLIETCMISFLKNLGVSAHKSSLGPGAFIGDKKVGFIGLRIRENITCHGFSINVLNDAKIFQAFDPCGISSLKVTSANQHVKLDDSLQNYMNMLAQNFLEILVKNISYIFFLR